MEGEKLILFSEKMAPLGKETFFKSTKKVLRLPMFECLFYPNLFKQMI
jgi:hypothetical protein